MERQVPQRETPGDAAKRRTLSPDDNPLVRAVGRVPAKVHTKLLVAFVATALLVVAVGVLGVRLLGQSNERVESLGELQRRSAAYSELRSRRRARPPAAGRQPRRRLQPDLPVRRSNRG